MQSRTWRSEVAQASSSSDMEVDAVCKDGHKGKSKGGKGRARSPKETSVTSAASEDTYRKTVGTKTQEEKKEKARSKERESRNAKARTRTSQSLK